METFPWLAGLANLTKYLLSVIYHEAVQGANTLCQHTTTVGRYKSSVGCHTLWHHVTHCTTNGAICGKYKYWLSITFSTDQMKYCWLSWWKLVCAWKLICYSEPWRTLFFLYMTFSPSSEKTLRQLGTHTHPVRRTDGRTDGRTDMYLLCSAFWSVRPVLMRFFIPGLKLSNKFCKIK